jgi:hypothetical protein
VSRRALIAATLATVLVTLGGVLYARDFIYEGVVVPILYVIWLGNLVINSADQAFLWLLAVFILLILLLRGLNLRPGKLPRMAEMQPQTVEKGRVAFWAVKMILGSRGEYSRRYFYLELKKLVLATLGHRENMSPREVEESLRAGTMRIPDDMQRFVQSWSEEGYTPLPGFWQRLLGFLTWKRRDEIALDAHEVERVAALLEKQLEISQKLEGKSILDDGRDQK